MREFTDILTGAEHIYVRFDLDDEGAVWQVALGEGGDCTHMDREQWAVVRDHVDRIFKRWESNGKDQGRG